MKKAEFLPSLYTRNEVVDEQHKELIRRINDLYEALDADDETREAKATETLAFLKDYTVFHFAEEEKLMEAAKYPLLAEHHAKHEAFVQTVQDLQKQLADEGATETFADKVEEEVTNWLIKHIQGTDMASIDWINNRAGDQLHNML